jgi:Uma2 family endonuclease
MESLARARGYTWTDFVRLAEDDRRELVDGVLMEVDVPTKWHERIVTILLVLLDPWARRSGLVALASGYKVRVSASRGAMPDVQILTEAMYEAADENGLSRGRPEIAIEVMSPGSRGHDRVRKLQWYASIGVPEYWIVDTRDRTIEQLVLVRGTYEVKTVAENDEVFRPRGARGPKIPLAELWRALPTRKR